MTPPLVRDLLERFGSPGGVFSASAEEIERLSGVPPTLAVGLVNPDWEETDELLEIFTDAGVRLLFPDSPEIPPFIGRGESDWLFFTVLGDLPALENRTHIGIIGRRDASEEGLQIAHDLASAFAREEAAVFSGMARGIDRAAHFGALSEGGVTVGVLPMGLLRFIRKKSRIRSALEETSDGNIVLVSGCEPKGGWSVEEAMRRNRWVAEWCDAVIVVEAGAGGGTWKTARFARELGKPLWVTLGFNDTNNRNANHELARRLAADAIEPAGDMSGAVDRVLENL